MLIEFVLKFTHLSCADLLFKNISLTNIEWERDSWVSPTL